MAELKTKPTAVRVEDFLAAIEDEGRREDCRTVCELMRKAAKAEPKMWGPSIVGFGDCHLKYASGRELDWFLIGFAPRKKDLTLYILHCATDHDPLLDKLGKYKRGKGCLYLQSLEDVDLKVLKKLIAAAVTAMKKSAATQKKS